MVNHVKETTSIRMMERTYNTGKFMPKTYQDAARHILLKTKGMHQLHPHIIKRQGADWSHNYDVNKVSRVVSQAIQNNNFEIFEVGIGKAQDTKGVWRDRISKICARVSYDDKTDISVAIRPQIGMFTNKRYYNKNTFITAWRNLKGQRPDVSKSDKYVSQEDHIKKYGGCK